MSANTQATPASPLHTPSIAIGVGVWILIWAGMCFQEIFSAVRVWALSETYKHCFFVAPLCIYFTWKERQQLLTLAITPSLLPVPLILCSVVLWALGTAGDIALFTHIGVFSLLPLGIWLILGNKVAWHLWFPLSFFLFSIPIGSELVPLFQEITADLSTVLLRWSGIAVFREGLYISIPNGRFEVAEACSGVRFFIASVCLGVVYGYQSYQSTKKRIIFCLFAIVLPIVANGFRAYGIIMVGHLSDMKYAAGADHLIYGWVFFSLIIVMMVLVGNIWADNPVRKASVNVATIHSSWLKGYSPLVWLILTLPLLLLGPWKQAMTAPTDTGISQKLPEASFIHPPHLEILLAT